MVMGPSMPIYHHHDPEEYDWRSWNHLFDASNSCRIDGASSRSNVEKGHYIFHPS